MGELAMVFIPCAVPIRAFARRLMGALLRYRSLGAGVAILCSALVSAPAIAQKKYDSGASDTEIVIGQTMPYSGPASSYGTIGKVQAAYFNMVNEQGGVNGRKIKLINLDDS